MAGTRDPDGGIRRVTFTSEPPEYWQALHGDTLADLHGDPAYPITGDPELLLGLYRELVSPQVRYEDLICAVDLVDYSDPGDPFVVYPEGVLQPLQPLEHHRRNHAPDPAVQLPRRRDPARRGCDSAAAATPGGRIVSDPDALICCARLRRPQPVQ